MSLLRFAGIHGVCAVFFFHGVLWVLQTGFTVVLQEGLVGLENPAGLLYGGLGVLLRAKGFGCSVQIWRELRLFPPPTQ